MSQVPTDAPALEHPAGPARPLWARALVLVSSPRSVFEQFVDRPSWFWAAVTTSVVAMIASFLLWNSVIAPYALEQAGKAANVTSEQLAKMETIYANPVTRVVASTSTAAINFLLVVVTGLVLFAITSFLMGGKSTVKQAFAVASHAMLVHIPRAVISIPLAISRQDPSVTLGPGILFPVSEATGFGAKALAMFLAYFDLFNIWSIALCILGMSVVSRLPTRQVAIAIVSAFLGLAVLFSLVGALFQRG